ncbi:hypothetical protein HU200_054293 [Digitaria exilis]|uniref:Uncharacterized protein n=1 Tax=Digitaria exilis TaxID=1010633 RepID=A0A835AVM7_9POAL|nr:hypothetical protein HU200_054293 [Digitaria exilis]
MAAGRKLQQTAAVAAVAVVVVVLLAAAAVADAQGCGVSRSAVTTCMSYCNSDKKASDDCCRPLRSANLDCLCDKLQSMPRYRDCATKLKNDCSISRSC